jgi:hypothetical protein
MEIQDIGLPGWTLHLPNGMVLKMGSAQGVLIIPDGEPEKQVPDEPARYGFSEAGLSEAGEYEPTDLRDTQ